jgi:hypothetical protein
MQHSNPLLSLDVDVRTVANVIADWTGVPLSSLMKDEQTELLTLENEIGKRVVGQDVALRPSPSVCVRQNRPHVRERSAGRVPAGRTERRGENRNRACAGRCHVRRREVTHYD